MQSCFGISELDKNQVQQIGANIESKLAHFLELNSSGLRGCLTIEMSFICENLSFINIYLNTSYLYLNIFIDLSY